MDISGNYTTLRIIEEIVKSCDQLLLEEARNGHVYCSLPEFLLTRFKVEYSQNYKVSEADDTLAKPGKPLVYRGIKFVPGYEADVVIYHDSYYQFQEFWMIQKVPLSSFMKFSS